MAKKRTFSCGNNAGNPERAQPYNNSEFTQQDGKSHTRDERDKAITCVFCRDLH